MKKIVMILTTLLLSISLWGCSAEPKGAKVTEIKIEQITPDKAAGITVGWTVYAMDNTFFQRMDGAVRDKAVKDGITLLAHNQNYNPQDMVNACKSMIAQDIDALVISPCSPEKMPEIIEAAHEKDIPVVIVDIGDGGGDKDAIIVSDGYEGGKEVGNYAVNLLKEKGISGKKLGIVKCEESAVYANQRGEGFKEVTEAAGYEIPIEERGDSKEDLGYEAAKKMLKEEPDLAAIFAENDMMALGAVKAAKEAGSDALIFGYDGNDAAVNAIVDKKMHGTMKQDAEAMGEKGLETAEQILRGESITYDNPETKEIFVDGYLIGEDSYRADK
ncbi:MAG: substrate-binding domain-containing protein [Eubacteriales bacterium]|nr:substrate-binding domain-containing protein [Eubacteriales bacterium]